MSTPLTLAGLALGATTAAIAFLALTETAAAAAPVCASSFAQEERKSYILKCKKTVSLAQKGVALTQAYNATCNTNSYWNYGPAVTAKHLAGNTLVTVRYTCGHVEG